MNLQRHRVSPFGQHSTRAKGGGRRVTHPQIDPHTSPSEFGSVPAFSREFSNFRRCFCPRAPPRKCGYRTSHTSLSSSGRRGGRSPGAEAEGARGSGSAATLLDAHGQRTSEGKDMRRCRIRFGTRLAVSESRYLEVVTSSDLDAFYTIETMVLKNPRCVEVPRGRDLERPRSLL